MTCKTCKYLDVPLDHRGRRVVYTSRVYQCVAPVVAPVAPVSITKYHNYRWPPPRMHMGPQDGEGCPLYSPEGCRATP